MRLYIIRHGETEWNTRLCLQGHEGAALTDRGVELTVITAEALKDTPLDLCYTSSLARSVQTARIMTAGRSIPILIDDRLMEIGFGVLEGLSIVTDIDRLPENFHHNFHDTPFEYIPPEGGESIYDVIERSESFLRDLLADPALRDKSILLCSHACSSRALLRFFAEDKSEYWGGEIIPNCAVTAVEVTDGRGKVMFKDRIYYVPVKQANYFED